MATIPVQLFGQNADGAILPIAIDADRGVVISGTSETAGAAAALVASEAHIGEVGHNVDVLEITLSLDTNAYAAGDLLAETQEIATAFRVAAGKLTIDSIVANDKDDQGVAMDLVFLRSNVSLGTENSAPNVSDANADEIVGIVGLYDFVDLGGCQIATRPGIGLDIEAATASTSLYVGAVTRGAPTYSASGVTLKIGVTRH